MDQLIQNWLDARAEAEAASEAARVAEKMAQAARLPNVVRYANDKDIIKGAILWYADDSVYWLMVEEVLRPSDPYKAYIAHDGCRYGLDGAFVEVVND